MKVPRLLIAIIALCLGNGIATAAMGQATEHLHPLLSTKTGSKITHAWQIEFSENATPVGGVFAARLMITGVFVHPTNPDKVFVTAALYRFAKPASGKYQSFPGEAANVELQGTATAAKQLPETGTKTHWDKATSQLKLLGEYKDEAGQKRSVKVVGGFHPGKKNKIGVPGHRNDDILTLKIFDEKVGESKRLQTMEDVRKLLDQKDPTTDLQIVIAILRKLLTDPPCDEAPPGDAAIEQVLPLMMGNPVPTDFSYDGTSTMP